MTTFWILGALMMALALFFVLPPLLRKENGAPGHAQRDQLNLAVLRDQLRELDSDLAAGTIDAAAHESARHELEHRVAEDVQPSAPLLRGSGQRLTALIVGIAVVVGAIAFYSLLGVPAALDPAQVAAPNSKSHELTEQEMVAMVERLAQKLKDNPDNAEGWHMLARSYNAMGRFDEASAAYVRVIALVPADAQVLADYADSLAMAQGKTLQGEPEKIIRRALQADPKNLKALSLMGSAAFERRDYPGAITQWQKMLAILPADSDDARSIKSGIDEAKMLAAGKSPSSIAAPAGAPAPSVATNAAPSAAATIEGIVELDPALRAQAADTDTVFIYARAPDGGPKFPLAAVRKQVKDLPASFVLDDSMGMVSGAKLSSFALVVVSARVSKTGSPNSSPGDLEGLTAPIPPGTKNLKIRIDSRHK